MIVHYQAPALLLTRCIESCLRDELIDEVIVVDNDAAAGRLDEWKRDARVQVLDMPANVGYGRAANAGMAEASGSSLLVLNQDAALSEGAVALMAEAGTAAGAWLVGPRLVDSSGIAAPPKDRLPWPIKWPPPDHGLPVAPRSGRFAPWVSGAAMLFMPGHVDLRFDDRYFMYVEDEELCARVWDAGGRVVLVDGATVRHVGGTATEARWGRAEIALRIVAGRARFVQRRCGTVAAVGYLCSAIADRLRRVFTQRSA